MCVDSTLKITLSEAIWISDHRDCNQSEHNEIICSIFCTNFAVLCGCLIGDQSAHHLSSPSRLSTSKPNASSRLISNLLLSIFAGSRICLLTDLHWSRPIAFRMISSYDLCGCSRVLSSYCSSFDRRMISVHSRVDQLTVSLRNYNPFVLGLPLCLHLFAAFNWR